MVSKKINLKKLLLLLILSTKCFFSNIESLKKEQNWIELANKSSDSVVQVFCFKNIFNWLEPYKTPEQQSTCGTAFFINEEGHLITNAHVVDQAVSIFIQFPKFGRHRFDVELVAISIDRDLAVLKLTEESYRRIIETIGTIPFLRLGNSDKVYRAEEIIAIGFPLGQEWLKVTNGVISGIQNLGNQSLIQISAPINPGNSGGPALNKRGEVIGINTCVINQNGTQNIGYIIPAKEVLVFLNHMQTEMKKEENEFPLLLRTPSIGIIYQGSPETLIRFLNNPIQGGIYIIEILKNSLAEEIGIQKEDMLYKINGFCVDRFGDVEVPWSKDKISLSALTGQMNIGSPLEIEIYRKGKLINLKGAWKINTPMAIRSVYPPYEEIKYITIGGLVIMELTINHLKLLSQFSEHLQDFWKIKKQTERCLIISHVMSNSIAQYSRLIHQGMIIKEVNEEKTSTLEELEFALKKGCKNSNYITFLMKEDELFVAELKQVVHDEKKLSNMYFYTPSAIIKELEKKINKK